ncbi:MAG: hypothetical protein ACM3VX_01125, partial [Bacteroidota bacterium]
LCADLTFAHGTSAGEIIQAVDRVEKALREALPRVTRIYLEADGLARAERGRRGGKTQALTERTSSTGEASPASSPRP